MRELTSCMTILVGDILFVIGTNYEDVEAHDLTGEGLVCKNVTSQNFNRESGFTMLSREGFPIACGGSESTACEKYNPSTGTWSELASRLSTNRKYTPGVLINYNKDYWITGNANNIPGTGMRRRLNWCVICDVIQVELMLSAHRSFSIERRKSSELALSYQKTFPATAP